MGLMVAVTWIASILVVQSFFFFSNFFYFSLAYLPLAESVGEAWIFGTFGILSIVAICF
jgi:hypothetical protein